MPKLHLDLGDRIWRYERSAIGGSFQVPVSSIATSGPEKVTFENFAKASALRVKLWKLGVLVAVVPNLSDIVSNLCKGNYTNSPVTGAVCSISAITAISFYDLMRLRRYLNRERIAGFGSGFFMGMSTLFTIASGIMSLLLSDGFKGDWNYNFGLLWMFGIIRRNST